MVKTTAAGKRATAPAPAWTEALAAPFDTDEVKFKPQKVTGNRALALAYVDARVIQDRLDEVLGVEGWQDEYECLPDGSVICRLRLKLGDTWITKMDVGSPSEQPDSHDRVKAAFSDALKRAAVKFGIGRYLYRLPAQWADYDGQRKQFTQTPRLPAFAVREVTPAETIKTLPRDGEEFERRLQEFDARLSAKGWMAANDLVNHIQSWGQTAGYPAVRTEWPPVAIQHAVAEIRRYEAALRAEHGGGRAVA